MATNWVPKIIFSTVPGKAATALPLMVKFAGVDQAVPLVLVSRTPLSPTATHSGTMVAGGTFGVVDGVELGVQETPRRAALTPLTGTGAQPVTPEASLVAKTVPLAPTATQNQFATAQLL